MSEQHTPPQRPPFKLAGVAAIRHLNVRKEGPEDEKILAVDVKLVFKQVDRRLCAYFDEALESFLWRGDTNALIVRNVFLAPVTYANEISSATVQIGTHLFLGCDVKKFGIEPADGGVITLTCSVSLYPAASDVSDLAKLVQDEDQVSIEGPPDLFADQGAAQAAGEPTPGDLLVDAAGNGLSDGPDPLYDQAAELVRKDRKASISYVQRTLRIGYNRAARLLEAMEKARVVSAVNASGAREVLDGAPA